MGNDSGCAVLAEDSDPSGRLARQHPSTSLPPTCEVYTQFSLAIRPSLTPAKVVGLTGGIATGKSTVSRLLREEHLVPVIDADILARQVVEPGTRGYKKIVQAFGEEVILQDGSGKIDRKKLGEIVFGDEGRRRVLNGIVHPEVRWEMLKEVVRCWWRGEAWVVLDVPLLIESGIYRWVGEVVVVYWCVMPQPVVYGSADAGSPEQEQLARLMSRDGISAEAARARMDAQMGIEEKKGYATVVLDNSGGVAELQRRVREYVSDKIR